MGRQTLAIGRLDPGESVELKFKVVEMVPNPEWKLWKFWKPLWVEASAVAAPPKLQSQLREGNENE